MSRSQISRSILKDEDLIESSKLLGSSVPDLSVLGMGGFASWRGVSFFGGNRLGLRSFPIRVELKVDGGFHLGS